VNDRRDPNEAKYVTVDAGAILPVMRILALTAILLVLSIGPAQAQTAPPSQSPPGQSAHLLAKKTWFVRLIPPRPTFDKDMSPEETKAMQAHFVYWKDQFDKGICLFGGPVLDPRGVYGVLAIVAATEVEAKAIAEADPSVKAGINKVEVAEMRIAFLHVQSDGAAQ